MRYEIDAGWDGWHLGYGEGCGEDLHFHLDKGRENEAWAVDEADLGSPVECLEVLRLCSVIANKKVCCK